MRGYLAERGILGTSVLWFECRDNGEPVPQQEWRELALASVVTHDLPPSVAQMTPVTFPFMPMIVALFNGEERSK